MLRKIHILLIAALAITSATAAVAAPYSGGGYSTQFSSDGTSVSIGGG